MRTADERAEASGAGAVHGEEDDDEAEESRKFARLRIGQNPPGRCRQKYATAISPERMNANRPGQQPENNQRSAKELQNAGPPVIGTISLTCLPSSQPKSFCAQCCMHSKPAIIRSRLWLISRNRPAVISRSPD